MNIENLNIDIDLLKLANTGVVTLEGKSGKKKCIVIPIEDNDIFVSADEQGRAKAAYMHLTAWKSREERYGQTHYVKQSFSKEFREAHADMEKSPILGNGSPVQTKDNNAAQTVAAPEVAVSVNNDDDLPF